MYFKNLRTLYLNFQKRVKLRNIRCRILDVAVLSGLEEEVAHNDLGDPGVLYEGISEITS